MTDGADKQRRDVSQEEIEARRQARTGQKVERAVNEPGGRPAVVSAPAQGAEKKE